jgi:hypothetical protein
MHKLISGALYDFAGYITTRKNDFSVGGYSDPSPVLEAMIEWASLRNLNLDDPDIENWQYCLGIKHRSPEPDPPPTRRIIEL